MGDELMSGMTEFAERNNLETSEVHGLGGISSAVVSVYDPEKGAFKRFNIDQKGELVSLQGEITAQNGKNRFSRSPCFRARRRNGAGQPSGRSAHQPGCEFVRERIRFPQGR
jgi:hypothetical protein